MGDRAGVTAAGAHGTPADAGRGCGQAPAAPEVAPRARSRPRPALAAALLVHDDDDAAVEPAALAAQRRVAAEPTTATGSSTRSSTTTTAGRRRRRAARSSRACRRRPAARRADGDAGRKREAARPWTGRRGSSRSSRIRCRGEGVWRAPARSSGGRPPVLVTTFRTEVDYPRIVAYVAWFDHTRTSARVLPGPLRAAERARARADVGARRPALAPARDVQRRLHLPRRPERLVDRRAACTSRSRTGSRRSSPTATAAST